jgi:SagB-type dehydrogenase family enzyme
MMSSIALTRRAFCKVIGLFCLWGYFAIPHKLLSYEKKIPLPRKGGGRMRLPDPITDGDVSLEMTIHQRRTVRSFHGKALTLNQFSQLLWTAQGVTDPGGFKRAAPSAGALYPMDIYGAVGDGCIEGLGPGVYLYDPAAHSLSLAQKGDARRDIAMASLEQMWMSHAPITFVITAEYRRITGKYGRRGVRYAMIEAGHIGQNIFLQSQAMGLAAGIVGAFEDREVIRIMGIKDNREPLLIMPVGYKQ